MRNALLRGSLAAGAAGLVSLGMLAPPASADDDGLRDATRSEARAFLAAAGLDGPPRCVLISFSRSNARWALVSPTRKCGPNSGHTSVYKQGRDGQWTYLFYDMQVDACEKFSVPAAVARDLRPYVC